MLLCQPFQRSGANVTPKFDSGKLLHKGIYVTLDTQCATVCNSALSMDSRTVSGV